MIARDGSAKDILREGPLIPARVVVDSTQWYVHCQLRKAAF
jgi:hypothetical protein